MNSHAVSPWSYDENLTIWDGEGVEVADVINVHGQYGMCEWNARLIAAAPELLEDLLSRWVQTKCGCGHPACNRCEDDRHTESILDKAYGFRKAKEERE